MKRTLAVFGIVCLSVLVSCLDDQGPVAPSHDAGSAEIVDASFAPGTVHGFYFLPPLVPEPSPTGVFNPDLAPVVEVCRLSGTSCAQGEDPVARFTLTTGTGDQVITVDLLEEQYGVPWHTDLSNLSDSEDYRIRVLVGSVELGHADVDVVSSGSELKNVDTGEYVALKDGRTLPIHFRIEEGALCGSADGCVEQSVGQEGGTVTFLSDDATGNEVIGGIRIEPNSLPAGVDHINVVANFIPDDEISGRNPDVSLRTFPFAFNLEFEPAVTLTQDAALTVCQNQSALNDPLSPFFLDESLHGDLRILQDDDGLVRIKDPAPAGTGAAAACGDVIGMTDEAAPLWERLGSELGEVAARLFLPSPLHASAASLLHGGLTTTIRSTSDFYAVLPDEGLVSLWQGDGFYTDVFGLNDGTVSGTVPFGTGVHGQAFDFSRDGSTVQAPGNGIDGLQTLTISSWVNMDVGTADTVVQRFATLKTEKAVIRQNLANNGAGGQLHFYVNFGTTANPDLHHLTAPGVLQQGCFHHVAGTYDGTTMRLYLDGVELRADARSGTVATGNGVMLGQNQAFEGLEGRLDDVRVYDRALTATEVSQIQAAGDATAAGTCAPPTAGVSVAVLLSPDNPTITVGEDTGMLAEFLDAFGSLLSPASVTWTSSNTSVATVDATGLVTGIAEGSSVITVTDGVVSASTTVTVVPAQSMTLVFVQQPTNTIYGQTMSPVVVRAQDVTGQVLPGVTITLADGPDNPGGCGIGNGPHAALTNANGLVSFGNIVTQGPLGGCVATMVADGSLVGFDPASAESDPYTLADLGGTGTANINGMVDTGEWTDAQCRSFQADVPGGTTSSAVLCAMNDQSNLYLRMQFVASSDPQSSFDFTLEGGDPNVTDTGDDLLTVGQVGASVTSSDQFWFDETFAAGSCPTGSICSAQDVNYGGTDDVTAAWANDGNATNFEVAHPLASGDALDVSVLVGEVVKAWSGLNIYDVTGSLERTFFPGGGRVRVLIK